MTVFCVWVFEANSKVKSDISVSYFGVSAAVLSEKSSVKTCDEREREFNSTISKILLKMELYKWFLVFLTQEFLFVLSWKKFYIYEGRPLGYEKAAAMWSMITLFNNLNSWSMSLSILKLAILKGYVGLITLYLFHDIKMQNSFLIFNLLY